MPKTVISLNPESLNFLSTNQYKLCIFRGILSDSHVQPLILKTVNDLKSTIEINLSNNIYGYISTQKIKPGVQIYAYKPVSNKTKSASSSSSIPIETHQEMDIDKYGNLTTNAITKNTIKILNNSNQIYTTGICEDFNTSSELNPFCAVPIIYSQRISLNPSTNALFMFSPNTQYKKGMYLEKLENQGMRVETSNTEVREISFTIKAGWQANNQTWAKTYAPGTKLSNILVQLRL
ncbi:MAG: hypothetical protein N4A59_00560 [Marinifilum sp.]|jgi:hypothetical protein|nr:hypothetical protein [Marinifilum sp.]